MISWVMAAHSTSHKPAQVLEAVWTKFEPITSPTSRVMSKKPPKSPFFDPKKKVYSFRGSKIDPLADIFRTIPVRAVERGTRATRTANQKCKKSKTLASSPPGVKVGPKNVQEAKKRR